ncbi:BnaCnng78480D, partial [Brassica napus]
MDAKAFMFRPEKPALSTVPVWLDSVGVPLQFFNKDALKEIVGLVGYPIRLHPSTENLTNIEVAKVYTVIDPRKPLPEAVCSTQRNGFRKWFRSNKPIFGGLLETHVSSANAGSIINRVFPGWHYECNYEFSDLGKVWLLWHPSVSVSVLQKSLQCITCSVRLPFISTELVVTLVYGSNHRKERRELWSEISFLFSSSPISHLPWTVLGDFNQILAASEHSSPDAPSSSRGMRDFYNCTLSANLSDL